MTPSEKPRSRTGYSREESALAISACLSVAVTLGALMDDLCIVGGLVPTLLIDAGNRDEEHPGTLDLDVGLKLVLLDEGRYAAIRDRLVREDFAPDENRLGNPTLQRWRHGVLGVTIDFLLPPIPGADRGGRIHALEPDFGAVITPGLELAFDEQVPGVIEGRTLKGERATRTVPVCGPGAFTVLKALAFGDRGEPKDAFDLVYVLRTWPGGTADVARRIARHDEQHGAIAHDALAVLRRDFETVDAIGPARVVEFEGVSGDVADETAADARGVVDDLIRACDELFVAPRAV